MKKILVTGATGTQGGAVVDHLLSGDYGSYDLYGLTRDASSERARALADRGVTVVEGEMTDATRMSQLCDGMDAVFCVTTFFESGTEDETTQGITVANAAKNAGVAHVVYSSVAGADADTSLPHFDSKFDVEKHLAAQGLPTTVIRPVFFMQNIADMYGDAVAGGTLPMPLEEGVSLQMVDAHDIGAAVAAAIADPDRFIGETVHLAGDELTVEGMTDVLSKQLGRVVKPVHLDIETYREAVGDEFADMYVWFNRVGFSDDYEAIADSYGLTPRSFAAFVADSEAFRPAPATPS